jgi:hypothetical protein
MKPRDLAIVAAVVLLGGSAVADALRSSSDESSAPKTQSIPERRDGPEPQADAPEDWPAGHLQGALVFADAEDCRIRVIGLGGGRERPASNLVGFCRQWVAPIGQRLAYNTGGVRGSTGESFAVVDLRRAGVELGSFLNLGGDVLWSPDGQRVAWCTPDGAGQEFEIGTERPRSFERCPVAYSPDGSLVFAQGRRLISGGSPSKTWVATPGLCLALTSVSTPPGLRTGTGSQSRTRMRSCSSSSWGATSESCGQPARASSIGGTTS